MLLYYANFSRELGRLPTDNDLRFKDRQDTAFPSTGAFARLGTKRELIGLLVKFCRLKGGYLDVIEMCERYIEQQRQPADSLKFDDSLSIGYVYLYKHGSRQEYKIGKTNNALRREGELRIELPERIEPIHFITTDDPAGVEAYWHRRFAMKRKLGEWFALTADDVRAFKRWKRI